MSTKENITFKHAEPSQKELIHKWVAQPHIAKWVHGKGLKNLLEGLDKFFKGPHTTDHWIAYIDTVPFAYLLSSPEGEDAVCMDLFICDLNYLGKGLAVPLIKQFILTNFSHKKTILIDPEATNTRAVHVYKKAGFHITREFIAPWLPTTHYQMALAVQDLK